MLIVGLGNPGKKFQKTRHNLGFLAIDEIMKNFQWPVDNLQTNFNAKIIKGEINGKKIVLAKPLTFMNLSGQAVKKIIKYLKIKISDLIVIHDDLDLVLGQIKIVKNRGSAGHKGVESIIQELGSKDFLRIRIGICPKTGKPKKPEIFVLAKFNKEEEKIIKKIIKKVPLIIELIIKEGWLKAQEKTGTFGLSR